MHPNRIQTSLIQTVQDQMVDIPGGEILLRDDRIKHQWQVEIQPFLLATYPVTQEVYVEITNESPSAFTGEKHPVEMVSWREAVVFCNLLSRRVGLPLVYSFGDEGGLVVVDSTSDGYRLPSEAEWEYACKAATSGIRYGEIQEIAWYRDNSEKKTHPVGLKHPNPWGLYDMLGNVWEWCSDIYDESVYGSYRIMRGGGWCDEARGCMATNRRRSHPTKFKIDDLGFRLARNLNKGT